MKQNKKQTHSDLVEYIAQDATREADESKRVSPGILFLAITGTGNDLEDVRIVLKAQKQGFEVFKK